MFREILALDVIAGAILVGAIAFLVVLVLTGSTAAAVVAGVIGLVTGGAYGRVLFRRLKRTETGGRS